MDNDPDGIADLFGNASTGLATRFEALADNLLAAGGMLSSRENSINSQIREIEDRRSALEFRLVAKEAALVQQFSALDALLANLTATSDFLTTQLDQSAAINTQSNGG